MVLKSNITKLYVSYFLNGVVFFYGIEKIFYETIGIDAVGIAVVSVAYLATALLLDIPSGVLADRWSRKYIVMLSTSALIVSLVVLGFSENLIHYTIGAVIWGVYFILASGATEALTYDSLHELKRTNDYSKVLGREEGLLLVGIVLASVASGFIAEHVSLRATYFLSIIPAAIALLVQWTIKEPAFHKEIADTKFMDHLKAATRLLTSQAFMRNLSILLVAVMIVEEMTDEYGQVYFIQLGFTAVGVGILNALFAGSAAVGQFVAHQIHHFSKWLLPLMAVSFGLFAFLESTLGLAFFFLAVLLKNSIENLTVTHIQDSIPSPVRATVLSVLGFAGNITAVPIIVAFGFIAREYDVFTAFQVLSVLFGVFTMIILFGRFKKSRVAGKIIS